MEEIRPNVYFNNCMGKQNKSQYYQVVEYMEKEWKFANFIEMKDNDNIYVFPSNDGVTSENKGIFGGNTIPPQKYLLIFDTLSVRRSSFAKFILLGYSVCFFLKNTTIEEVRRYIELTELPAYFILLKTSESIKKDLDNFFEKTDLKVEYIFAKQSKELFDNTYYQLNLRLNLLDENVIQEIQQEYSKKTEQGTLEVEWRIGYLKNDKFSGGVNEKDWNEIKTYVDSLVTRKKLIFVSETKSTVKKYLCSKNRNVRYITNNDSSSSIYVKTNINDYTNQLNDSNIAIRLGVSREKVIKQGDINFKTECKEDRTENRTRYVYQYKDEYQIHLTSLVVNSQKIWQAEIELIKNIDPNDALSILYPWLSKKFIFDKNSTNNIKNLSKQVEAFTPQLKIDIKQFAISPKLDGIRTLLFYNNRFLYSINDQFCNKFILHPEKDIGICIFDSEEYEGCFYIFDVMYYNNESILNLPYEKRISYISKCVKNFNTELLTEKAIRIISNVEKDIIWASSYGDKDTDGWVITNKNNNYENTEVYKYKPPENLTVDFLIKKYKNQYYLFAGLSCRYIQSQELKFPSFYSEIFPKYNCNKLTYVPYPFSTVEHPTMYIWKDIDDNGEMDNKIGEFIWKNNKWEIVKERKDRQKALISETYFGNDYLKTVMSVWKSIQNPLLTKDIIEMFTSDNYFKSRSGLQEFNKKFNSKMKEILYKKYFYHAPLLIDLCSGEGNDVYKFNKLGVKRLIAMEQDPKAVAELQRRYGEISRPEMKLTAIKVDLTSPSDSLLALTGGVQTSRMNCSFGFHYLIESEENCRNIATFISSSMKKDGVFLLFVFDGEKIFNFLKKEEIKIETADGKLKYNIKGVYNTKTEKFQKFGQKIKVLLPFSDTELYEEPLVNINAVSTVFEEYGLQLIENRSFSEHLNVVETDEKLKELRPTMGDKFYVGLYSYLVFQKMR